MRIFESHCHINDKSFNKDLDKVIERANSSGVSHMMIAGVTLDTCKKALEIANNRIDSLLYMFERSRIMDYMILTDSRRRMFAINFIAGIGKGFEWVNKNF